MILGYIYIYIYICIYIYEATDRRFLVDNPKSSFWEVFCCHLVLVLQIYGILRHVISVSHMITYMFYLSQSQLPPPNLLFHDLLSDLNIINTTGVSSRARTAYHIGVPRFVAVCVVQAIVLCVVFCGSLFAILFFFFCPSWIFDLFIPRVSFLIVSLI